MDTILVVCYSYTGVTKRLASLLCSHRGWPLGEIFDAKPRGVVRCVLDSLLRRHPPIRYEGPDPADFRTVVLMSPIWAYRLAGPMRTFVRDHAQTLHRVAVISTMEQAGASNAVREIAHTLDTVPIRSAAFTQHEVEDGTGTGRLLTIAEQLQPGSRATQASNEAAWHPQPLAEGTAP